MPNKANGNCLYEAVIDNVNSRSCFKEDLNETPEYYRMLWNMEGEEKQNERDQKRATDEANLKAKRTEEKQNERDQKQIHPDARLALFKNHTRDGRIFECICCHRRLFEPGVKKIGDTKIF